MKIALLALYDVYSFGIRGLNSLLKQEGHDVTSLFFKNSTYTDGYYTQDELNVLIETIKDIEPDLLGIAVRSPLFPLFKEISKAIKPDTSILVGGHHPTADPESCKPYADWICVGEGEQVVLDLFNDILAGRRYLGETTKGIWPDIPGPCVNDMDSIPFDHYGDSDIYLYSDPKFDTLTERNLWTSRGCLFNCTYCFGNVTRKLYGDSCVRRKTVDRVIENVRYLQKTFPVLQEIIFTDHVFTFDIDWIIEFCRAFPATGLKFRCFGHFSLATPHMLAMLKNAGMTHISFGIESGSKRIRKLFNRNTPEEQIIETS